MARGQSLRPRTPGVTEVLGTDYGTSASFFWRAFVILKSSLVTTALLCLSIQALIQSCSRTSQRNPCHSHNRNHCHKRNLIRKHYNNNQKWKHFDNTNVCHCESLKPAHSENANGNHSLNQKSNHSDSHNPNHQRLNHSYNLNKRTCPASGTITVPNVQSMTCHSKP